MAGEIQKRQPAIKLWIADLLSGQYVKEEGWTPNYVLTTNGIKASRVNLIGAVVSMPAMEANYRNLMLDDGTGKIDVRSFDEADPFQGVGLGDVVFVVGRPREYSSEAYIMPEIVKKVQNHLWIQVRKLELGKPANVPAAPEPAQAGHGEAKEIKIDEKLEPEIPNSQNEVSRKKEEKNAEAAPEIEKAEGAMKGPPGTEEQSPQQKVYSIIKELDLGEGADFEQVIAKSGASDAENIISQLLMEGEIFELGKGKLKVLE